VTITLEDEFSETELEIIREMAEYFLDRDYYSSEADEQKLEDLISILKKTGSELLLIKEEEEEEWSEYT